MGQDSPIASHKIGLDTSHFLWLNAPQCTWAQQPQQPLEPTRRKPSPRGSILGGGATKSGRFRYVGLCGSSKNHSRTFLQR